MNERMAIRPGRMVPVGMDDGRRNGEEEREKREDEREKRE